MHRTLLSVGLLLAIALPCQAQNKLTPKEIADGWILLFDGETTFGWKANNSAPGKALKVTDGALDLADLGASGVVSTVPFGPFELFFEYQCNTDKTLFGVVAQERGASGYLGQFLPKTADWKRVRIFFKDQKIRFDVPGMEQLAKMAEPWASPCVFRLIQ